MKRLKIILMILVSVLSNSCGDRTIFSIVRMFYVDHVSCGNKNYGVFEVFYQDSHNFAREMTDTLTIGEKLYRDLVLIDVPDTLREGDYYGVEFYNVGKTKVSCSRLEHMNEITGLRMFYRISPQRKRTE